MKMAAVCLSLPSRPLMKMNSDLKMEQLDEICTECGATDVVEADERVWKVRRSSPGGC